MNKPNLSQHDALYHLAQIGGAGGVQLVRIASPLAGNVYLARPVEFDAAGDAQLSGDETLEVTNLGEQATAGGEIEADTDAVAIDVEGRWIVFVRPATSGGGSLPARITAALGGAKYSARLQTWNGAALVDATPSNNLTAINLAEATLGPGAAVDVGTAVLLTRLGADAAGSETYAFDHPAYAKYLG